MEVDACEVNQLNKDVEMSHINFYSFVYGYMGMWCDISLYCIIFRKPLKCWNHTPASLTWRANMPT